MVVRSFTIWSSILGSILVKFLNDLTSCLLSWFICISYIPYLGLFNSHFLTRTLFRLIRRLLALALLAFLTAAAASRYAAAFSMSASSSSKLLSPSINISASSLMSISLVIKWSEKMFIGVFLCFRNRNYLAKMSCNCRTSVARYSWDTCETLVRHLCLFKIHTLVVRMSCKHCATCLRILGEFSSQIRVEVRTIFVRHSCDIRSNVS